MLPAPACAPDAATLDAFTKAALSSRPVAPVADVDDATLTGVAAPDLSGEGPVPVAAVLWVMVTDAVPVPAWVPVPSVEDAWTALAAPRRPEAPVASAVWVLAPLAVPVPSLVPLAVAPWTLDVDAVPAMPAVPAAAVDDAWLTGVAAPDLSNVGFSPVAAVAWVWLTSAVPNPCLEPVADVV